MNFADYAALLEELDRYRALVNHQFEQIFGEQRDEPNDTQLWHEEITAEELTPRLEKLDTAPHPIAHNAWWHCARAIATGSCRS